jgi:lipoprotein NlpD
MEDRGGVHIRIVQPGDTLYAIAFENQLDAQQLAAWNGIKDTSKLQIGKRLRLTKPNEYVAPNVARRAKAKAAKRVATSENPKTSTKSKTAPSSRNKTNVPTNIAKNLQKRQWLWPTKGRVIKPYSAQSGQQGIDIQGRLGQPVLATDGGEVVYVGNGLKGYGNLVIIKHDEEFLSAYAHNQETFVQEGQTVEADQRIASLGRNNAGVVALHFQIRLHGEPVNPLSYLSS